MTDSTTINDFPIKVGNLANVESFASTLTEGQEQLLITREGELFLTKGDGTYIKINDIHELSNSELLEKFSEDENGNLLFNGKLLNSDFDVFLESNNGLTINKEVINNEFKFNLGLGWDDYEI